MRRLFAADPDNPADVTAARSPDLASPRTRLVAAAVDVTLMVSALFWVGALGFEPAFGNGGPPIRVRVLACLAVLGHLVVLEAVSGQTVGKRLAGIRVVDEVTGGPIGFPTAVHRVGARALFWFVSFLALADPKLQTLHDRSAGTLVVKLKTPAELPCRAERIE
jgi:uncharacterized RDD family membrane protein YckC